MIQWLYIRLFSKATNYQQIDEIFLFTVDFVLSSVSTLRSHQPAKGNLHSEERATHHESLKVCNLSKGKPLKILTTIGSTVNCMTALEHMLFMYLQFLAIFE